MSIEVVKMKYEEQLMQLPNVRGVGIGEKEGKAVIKVFVTHRVDESALKPQDFIPKFSEGFENVVEEIGNVTEEQT